MVRLAILKVGLWGFLAFGFMISECHSEVTSGIPIEDAKRYFKEAESICQADRGQLWGISLCGPLMFVDPGSRSVVANFPDLEGVLKEENGVFLGKLPAAQNIANTAVTWAGLTWTQMMWPLPDDVRERRKFIAHELFHRIQGENGIPPMKNCNNSHLDTLEGRYYLQLEWRALARALQAIKEISRTEAIKDAVLFRAVRYSLFPNAPDQEQDLELNEGLAEYTGVKLANSTPEEQIETAVLDLNIHTSDGSFVRSFAYATGPAYGLLLDRYVPEWRQNLKNAEGMDVMLQMALAFTLPENLVASAKERAQFYDGNTLWASETEREAERQKMVALYRGKFVDGPVLVIPLRKMNVQFDPLGDAGTVYPNMRITDEWGVLEVKNGALLKSDWSAVIVVAPLNETSLQGDGWTLELKPDWKLVPGSRKGDFTLSSGL